MDDIMYLHGQQAIGVNGRSSQYQRSIHYVYNHQYLMQSNPQVNIERYTRYNTYHCMQYIVDYVSYVEFIIM